MAMACEKDEIIRFLKVLQFHFDRGKRAYANYFEAGKLFGNACVIKRNNLLIHKLIMAEGYLLPREMSEHLINIVDHIDAWLVCWNNLKERAQPGLDDVFVFENSVRFPKESEKALMDYLHALETK